MKFQIERKPLLDAITKAASVIAPRNTVPILGNVHIRAEAGQVTMTGTDLDIEVSATVPATVEAPGVVTVPAAMLADIARKLPGGALVSVALADHQVTIKAGRSRFVLPTLPAEDYPAMASAEYAVTIDTTAAAFCRVLDKAKFAISTEEARYYLNGVYMHVAQGEDGPVLRCVATDGHRLARVDAPLPDGAADMPGVIVPRKTVGELRKLLEDDDAQIAVSVSETKLRFATPEITLTSKVIDGTFPDYTRVIPSGNSRRLEVDAGEFAKAVDRVATVSSERSRAVKLLLEDDRLVLSVNAPDSGAAEEELVVAYSDDRLEIGFNAKYLLEIASQVDRENAVFLFNSSGDPTLMREGNDTSAIYVVMPMRV
jgi:DNA polymerase-3 subunit beta